MRSGIWLMGLAGIAAAVAFVSFVSGGPAVAADVQTLEYSTVPADFTPVSHPARVCCKRGRYDWWTTRHACWRAGGYRVPGWHCRNDYEVRICCKRGYYDWWATPRACARAGGYRVSGWQCRNG
jgi:hypothetical protein